MPNRTVDNLVQPRSSAIPRLQRRLQGLIALGALATIALVGLATALPMYQQLRNKTNLHVELDVQVRALATGNLLSHSNEGILMFDAEQRIIGLNPAGSRLLRCSLEQLEGRPADAALLAELGPSDCAALWQTVIRTGSWQGEVRLPRGADEQPFSAWLSLAAVYDEQRQPSHFTGLFTDISAAKAEEQRIRQMAYHDRLTGLPNRSLVRDRLAQALRKAQRSGELLAVLFLDLDRFKPVNDTYGHAVGDLLLKAVAERLTRTVRDCDTVARLGGDEFLVILEELENEAMAEQIATRLVEVLQQPFPVDGHDLQIGTSIGVALYPQDGEEGTELARHADAAMYRAKENGRNCFARHTANPRRQAD